MARERVCDVVVMQWMERKKVQVCFSLTRRESVVGVGTGKW